MVSEFENHEGGSGWENKPMRGGRGGGSPPSHRLTYSFAQLRITASRHKCPGTQGRRCYSYHGGNPACSARPGRAGVLLSGNR